MENRSDDVTVSLPFSRLMKLLEPQETLLQLQDELSSVRSQMTAQRREIEGLHRIQCEIMTALSDLRRSHRD